MIVTYGTVVIDHEDGVTISGFEFAGPIDMVAAHGEALAWAMGKLAKAEAALYGVDR